MLKVRRMCSGSLSSQTDSYAERTENVFRKFMVKTSFQADTASAASKLRKSDVSYVLVVEDKG